MTEQVKEQVQEQEQVTVKRPLVMTLAVDLNTGAVSFQHNAADVQTARYLLERLAGVRTALEQRILDSVEQQVSANGEAD